VETGAARLPVDDKWAFRALGFKVRATPDRSRCCSCVLVLDVRWSSTGTHPRSVASCAGSSTIDPAIGIGCRTGPRPPKPTRTIRPTHLLRPPVESAQWLNRILGGRVDR
jgi:hypothetical protein